MDASVHMQVEQPAAAAQTAPDLPRPRRAAAPDGEGRAAQHPTIWGLTPTQLHDRFWAGHGVQVVRQGEPCEIVEQAELFLLCAPQLLAVLPLARALDRLYWDDVTALALRLHVAQERGYRETVVTDAAGQFVGFRRTYAGTDSRIARVVLTRDPALARAWQRAADVRAAWRGLKRAVPRGRRAAASAVASVYDRGRADEVMRCVQHLVRIWERPDTTIARPRRGADDGADAAGVWADPTARLDGARFVGRVWVGAGRAVAADASVVGPAVLWDDPAVRPPADGVRWGDIEPAPLRGGAAATRCRRPSSLGRALKRLFDFAFAATALLFSLPLYPLVMLAIWLEDGRPFFFGHRRETLGGREFFCWKFRSMRKDAERIKQQLAAQNQADGPQFYMEHDPRLTRVGRFLRRYNLDELPQFWNVLVGDMSIVGPRPSPYHENQFCPPWREARLSVRPGITGLWQVMRTRQPGMDFQEWIRYDLQYVESAGWRLDLWIIWQTARSLIPRMARK